MSPALVRAAFIVFHLIQYAVASLAGFNAAGIVAAVLLGARLLPVTHFERTFKVGPQRVSQIGSLLWVAVGMIEMRILGG